MSSEPALPAVPRTSVAITDGALDPRNAGELMEMAKFIAASNLKPKGLNTAADCFLVMLYGQAYGFHPAEALQSLHVVHGKVAAGGETLAGLIQSHPLCKDYRTWVEGEGEERAGCVQSWRKSREKPNDVVRFSLADARHAGLYPGSKDSAWFKYPDDLLIWKAVARDKRRNWPDAHRKLEVVEDIEEVREVKNVTPRAAPAGPDPLLAQLAAPRTEIATDRTIELELVESEASGVEMDTREGREQAPEEAPVSATIEASAPKKRSADVAGIESGLASDSPISIPEILLAAIKQRVRFLALTKSGEKVASGHMESMVVDMLSEQTPELDIEKAIRAWKMPK